MRALIALWTKELLQHRAYPMDLLSLAVSPFLIIAPFLFAAKIYPRADLHATVAVGLILWYWLSTFFWSVGFGLRDEMEEGVLESLLLAPVPLPTLLLAKALDNLLVNLYITGSILLLLRVVAGVTLPIWSGGFALMLLGASLAFSALALLHAALLLLVKQASGLGNITQEAMGVLGGMTAPVTVLPRPVQWVSGALPLTYAIAGARSALDSALPLREFLVLLGFAAAFGALGLLLLDRAERRLRLTGGAGEY
ncbi:MAG: ABC transporter permease [Bacillota bacterium]